jgi:hypothetical protein
MPGNLTECNTHALHCAQLAETAATPEARRALIALAETWQRLAAELESDQAFLQAMSELELSSQPCEPYEVLPVALGLRSWAA